MLKDYQNLSRPSPLPILDIEEKKKRHDFESIAIGRDLLAADTKSALEQIRQ